MKLYTITIFIRLFQRCILLILICSVPWQGHAEESMHDEPAAIMLAAEPLVENFVTAEHWAAVKNLTAAARAIVLIPSGGQGGLILGFQRGKGVLLVRHGFDWSDPVFIRLNAIQIGLLIGGQRFSAAGAILSDAALDQVLSGKTRVGGSGDFTIGVGVSGHAAGGASGGIEMLMVSSNKGVFLGGSFEGVTISIDDEMNRQAYGDAFEINEIVSDSGGIYLPAESIRRTLKRSAYEAVWGDAQ